eukprot:CAMPEP_0169226100 /NCGR_PEP_ID=MMETSP1016-20121227/23564_1 /TAXON_ID=342587 /ORGANISM="Karlodinium micrum, Strain CCMP2283" /LENGTH=93 /DNA_ID=CAMNT_0009304677 /DNA_START=40 /DNA_END=318 /DNA_ORIENTATION=+
MSRSANDTQRTANHTAAAVPSSSAPPPTHGVPVGGSTGTGWPPWLQPGGFIGTDSRASDESGEGTASARDRKALDGILAELRKEVDRLDEDAW